MTAPSTTPPLDEREAVARTEIREELARDIGQARLLPFQTTAGLTWDTAHPTWRERAFKAADAILASSWSGFFLNKILALRTENETLRAERGAARELAYELKLAAAGGEDVPGAAYDITVEDVARWRDEAWARTDALDRDVAKAKRALALTLRFVDRAAGEGITFLEGDNGEPAQDAADICFAVADIFVIEDLDSDKFRALTNPEPPHGD